MAVTLQLKRRKTGSPDIDAWRRTVRDILGNSENDARKTDQLLDLFVRFPLEFVHDKRWLVSIVDYQPTDERGQPKKQPLTKQAEWLRLAIRVDALDDTREGLFALSPADVERIWRRLTSEEFELVGRPAAFSAFVLDFCDAAGKRFAGDVEEE